MSERADEIAQGWPLIRRGLAFRMWVVRNELVRALSPVTRYLAKRLPRAFGTEKKS